MFDLVRNRASLGLRSRTADRECRDVGFDMRHATRRSNRSAAAGRPKTFASPDDAGKGLFEAAKSGNQEAIVAIFGPGSKEIISTGECGRGQSFA